MCNRPSLPICSKSKLFAGRVRRLWGANAVNGVINIITKSAKDTQGFLVEGGGGDELKGFGGIRYGGTMGSDTYYRAYVMHQSYDSLELAGGGDAQDGTTLPKAASASIRCTQTTP